jgi:ATP-binding cassette subfamily B protein
MKYRLPKAKNFQAELRIVGGVLVRTFAEQWGISRLLLVGNLIMVPINALTPLLASFLAGRAINQLIAALSGHASTHSVYVAFTLAAVVGLGVSLLSPLQRFLRANADVKSELFLERRMNETIMAADLPTMESPRFVELFNKTMYRHVYAHRRVVDNSFQMATNLLALAGAGLVLVHLSIWLLPVLILAVLPSIITSFYVGQLRDRIVWSDPENMRSAERRTSHYMANEDTNIEIRLNTAQNYFLETANRFRNIFAQRSLKVNRTGVKLNTAAAIFEDLVFLGVQLSLIGRVLSGRFGVGTYTFYFQTIQRFSSSSSGLFFNASQVYEDSLVLRDFNEIIKMRPKIVSKKGAIKLPANILPTIVFKNVSFTYPDATRPSLENLNFTIKPGEKIALVGENGAGKTTIVKLLARLYDPTSGTISVNGHDLRDVDIASWHEHIGALMQNYGRYIYSVRSNIGVGRYQKMDDDDRLADAIEDADAEAVVSDLPKGVEQPLATMFKDGVNLSGGQWQRLGLARSLFRQANLLVLDEPTAAVDAKAEYQIFKNLLKQQKGRSTIIISHRFSTVRQANTIYVLDGGRIIQKGSHKQLVAQDGLYKSLFDMQAEGYR